MSTISRRKVLALGAGLPLTPWVMLPAQADRASGVRSHVRAGVNVAGAEFGSLEGRRNFQYVYADDAFITWCLDQGFTLIRVPFKWARLMPSPDDTALRADDFAELRRIARLCTARNAVCLLDMHDFGRYRETTLGDPSLPADFFARTWRLMASQLGSERVWFGLMNEPHDQDMDKAMAQFQAAAIAIRETGHSGRILVPSGGWSGAHSFPRGGNVERFRALRIEGDWSVEVHQYLDDDNSGTHHAVHVPGKGARVLAECTATLRANGWTGVLAEYGWSDTPDGNREGNDLIASIQDALDVWVGHAYWATGPWWKDYPYAIGPTASNGQLAILKRYM